MADEQTQAANDAIRAEAAAAGKGPKVEDNQTEASTATAVVDTDDTDTELGEAGEKALNAFKKRARDAEKEARDLAARVKEFEDRDKSDQEKLEERASTAEQRAAGAEQQLLKFQIATDKKLPVELADRLQGDNKKELEADAERLLALVKPNGKPEGDIGAGRGEGGSGDTFNDALRAAARR